MKGKTLISILVLAAVVALVILLGRSSTMDKVQEVSLEATQDGAFNVEDVDQLLMVQLESGSGPEIMEGQTASVHYTGYLVDNVIFDSSLTRGESFNFVLGSGTVIDGWEIGIKGMKVGEERRLIVPPQYGYGDQQVGPIPPNSVLIFDVELLEIK
jgi:FKBP-type peptidyl-prolyl cis-trans isomerase FkpA